MPATEHGQCTAREVAFGTLAADWAATEGAKEGGKAGGGKKRKAAEHASLFAPVRAAEKDKAKAAAAAAARAEQVAARAAYYHASSGVSPQHVARRKGQGGPGGCAK